METAMLDMTDHYLARHFDEQEADDSAAERFDVTKAALTSERDREIREALAKPDSSVSLLLDDNDTTAQAIDDVYALIRMAADWRKDPAVLGRHVKRMVDGWIETAAVPSDKQVQARIAHRSRRTVPAVSRDDGDYAVLVACLCGWVALMVLAACGVLS